jgi:hypothetical protein
MIKNKIPGTLMIWPGVAEELVEVKHGISVMAILKMWMPAFLHASVEILVVIMEIMEVTV